MKKQMWMVMIGMVLSVSWAGATTTYIYDGTVSNWYGAGSFTAAGSAPTKLNTKADYYGVNYENEIYVCGANDGVNWLGQDDWAGAEWTAPAGEVITEVIISGYYRSETHVEGVGVFGGKTSAGETQYYASNDWSNVQVIYGPVIVSIPEADQVTKLQLRALWQMYGGTGFCYGNPQNLPDQGNYNGQITAVQITTVPEPISLAVLGLGGMWIMRKRK